MYVVVVGLPLVLIFTFCCSGAGDAKLDKSKHPKKTDAVQDDDEESDDEEEEDEEEKEEEIEDMDKGDSEPLIATRSSARKRRARKE